MKILTGSQIKEADKYTIEHEPISSLDLMERASLKIAEWICNNIERDNPLLFLIGKGNNGGDGLAVARILYHSGYDCCVFLLYERDELSEDSQSNLERLPNGIKIKRTIQNNVDINTILIDCLLGSGTKGAVNETISTIIELVNSLPNKVLSIDLPSGMIAEFDNKNQTIIRADVTLTLEFPKLAMLLPEAGNYAGKTEVLPIGLSKEYICHSHTLYHYITPEYIESIRLKRDRFAHKGTYGHALLICGSKGMAGAAVLSTGGALRSGCGLLTLHIPYEERVAVQVCYPSAILSLDKDSYFSELPKDIDKYSAIGIGCGLKTRNRTVEAFKSLLNTVYNQPVVFDADALNILAENYRLLDRIPQGSILTPHPGELKRLIGDWKDDQHKIELVRILASKLKSIIVVKGANTMICLPDGNCYFNSTGNSGMAKGGSGDVLTGYITGLLARGYEAKEAAILGVYTHGLAGDNAAAKYGEESMNSRDIIDFL